MVPDPCALKERPHLEKLLDDAIADTSPASDPVSISFDPAALGTADDAAAEPTVDDPGGIAHRERSPRGLRPSRFGRSGAGRKFEPAARGLDCRPRSQVIRSRSSASRVAAHQPALPSVP
jgi:hypothetical protein